MILGLEFVLEEEKKGVGSLFSGRAALKHHPCPFAPQIFPSIHNFANRSRRHGVAKRLWCGRHGRLNLCLTARVRADNAVPWLFSNALSLRSSRLPGASMLRVVRITPTAARPAVIGSTCHIPSS